MGDRATLLEMGFDHERVEYALAVTNSTGLQAALDHLEAHQDEPLPANWKEEVAQKAQASSTTAAQENLSDTPQESAKVFRDMDLAMYHADKSGHDDFEESSEEIKPLTEEEKANLRARMQEKRAKQASKDAEERRANELIRRKAGQDAVQAREELEKKERIKDAERKRREKQEDIAAKARVKAQIEEDKKRRAEKAAKEKALREGEPLPGAVPTDGPPTKSSAIQASTANESRLRVRAPGGAWTGTLPSTATLLDVQNAVLKDGKGGDATRLQFSTTFPRHIFTADEQAKSLRELGLVPSAALESAKSD
ncbi:hypothetical protein MYAM1_000876 [Malassezia yamatoensis]|uniref:UBX domain-containing protein 1 n=1 Tax=Malassezia yamatoensis TaxID=253288 RepID=A0AAJ5YV19_9BASI|nr:hypothetical protein MYAM1_000876 [Malassezia yamatoensis]